MPGSLPYDQCIAVRCCCRHHIGIGCSTNAFLHYTCDESASFHSESWDEVQMFLPRGHVELRPEQQAYL